MNGVLSFTPALLGLMIIIQTGLNREIGSTWGMPAAAALNGMVLTLCALTVYCVGVSKPGWLSPELSSNFDIRQVRAWYVIPGVLGMCLVMFVPWSVAKWGGVHTFVLLVTGQLVGSLLWDWRVEGMPISKERMIGIALAWGGVLLATRGR